MHVISLDELQAREDNSLIRCFLDHLLCSRSQWVFWCCTRRLLWLTNIFWNRWSSIRSRGDNSSRIQPSLSYTRITKAINSVCKKQERLVKLGVDISSIISSTRECTRTYSNVFIKRQRLNILYKSVRHRKRHRRRRRRRHKLEPWTTICVIFLSSFLLFIIMLFLLLFIHPMAGLRR